MGIKYILRIPKVPKQLFVRKMYARYHPTLRMDINYVLRMPKVRKQSFVRKNSSVKVRRV